MRIFSITALLSVFLVQTGCGVYSFTGASVSPEVKSVSIDFFPSYAALAPANMPQEFTEALRNLFVSRTNLDLITKNGDIRFEGYISGYQTRPVAIQGNETAAKNRLTITVNVTYTNTKDSAKDFEKQFTRFADFEAAQNLTDVEQTLIQEINEQLILDIFNEAVVNW
ncbi:LPS assembly lipoprotein LptE [Bacteroidota bacterium]